MELKTDARATVDKLRILTSPTALKFMEEDLVRIEQQIEDITEESQEASRSTQQFE
jgi:hypothetical protein